ncbi:MAG: hypothetical protein VX519_04480 [Myxococcota bacterium]|nr:hypothetical protein [Myxococcota bacterium]
MMRERNLFWALLCMGVVGMPGTAFCDEDSSEEVLPYRSYEAVAARGNTCVFGVLKWCFAEQTAPQPLKDDAPIEVDLFGAYKFSSSYFKEEVQNCEGVGCAVDQTGFSNGVAVSYRTEGNGREDRDNGYGIAISSMPVVSGLRDNPGFEGSMGPVASGDGTLGYTNVRLILRRRHFFYLLRSRYFVGTFGAGIAIPVASENAGATFTGADGIKATIGGRMGIQIPITDRVEVGLVDHWGVWWYGPSVTQSAYLSSYGLHLSARL